jgi:hypothetical protein
MLTLMALWLAIAFAVHFVTKRAPPRLKQRWYLAALLVNVAFILAYLHLAIQQQRFLFYLGAFFVLVVSFISYKMRWFCPSCGIPSSAGIFTAPTFCSACGKRLSETSHP